MKMTDVQRITLIRLHEILAVINPKEAKDHNVAIHILRDGYHEDLYEQHSGNSLSDPFPEGDQKFVYDVLDAYATVNRSYKALPKKDKKDIDKTKLHFPGFDANQEAVHLAFAKFVVKKQGRWPELDHKGDFDSGVPMTARYDRMLSAFRKLKSNGALLEASAIKTMLDAVEPSEAKTPPATK
jgi:uncharacterized protein YfbU (UPF0304 family)